MPQLARLGSRDGCRGSVCAIPYAMPGRLYDNVYRASQVLDRGLSRVRDKLGLVQPPVILPYIGYGHAGEALIRARVVEDRGLDLGDRSTRQRLLVAYRRYATYELKGEPVIVRWGRQVYRGQTDDEGHLDLWVNPPPDAVAGWNRVRVRLARDPEGEEVAVSVFIADEHAGYGVISDIDDTVIETGATNIFKRAHALFWAAAEHRLPFEGVAAFYRALAGGPQGHSNNPIFYLSSSPWNLHDHLIDFFELHDMPQGPLLLRNWGFGPHGFAPNGKHRHKVDKAEQVLRTFPDLSFVLVGDTGQEDARHYATLVRRYPGRIRAVYLRDVGRRKADLDVQVGTMLDAGTPVLVADDTRAAAHHAEHLGLIPAAGSEDVEHERARDLGEEN